MTVSVRTYMEHRGFDVSFYSIQDSRLSEILHRHRGHHHFSACNASLDLNLNLYSQNLTPSVLDLVWTIFVH